jgi:hypothetical protein
VGDFTAPVAEVTKLSPIRPTEIEVFRGDSFDIVIIGVGGRIMWKQGHKS